MGVLDWDQPARRQGPQDTHHPHDTIERLCLDSGWVFISREVDYYRVRSGGHQSNVYVDIRSSERFSNMLFQCWFPIRFSLEKPPSGLFGRVRHVVRAVDIVAHGRRPTEPLEHMPFARTLRHARLFSITGGALTKRHLQHATRG